MQCIPYIIGRLRRYSPASELLLLRRASSSCTSVSVLPAASILASTLSKAFSLPVGVREQVWYGNIGACIVESSALLAQTSSTCNQAEDMHKSRHQEVFNVVNTCYDFMHCIQWRCQDKHFKLPTTDNVHTPCQTCTFGRL